MTVYRGAEKNTVPKIYRTYVHISVYTFRNKTKSTAVLLPNFPLDFHFVSSLDKSSISAHVYLFIHIRNIYPEEWFKGNQKIFSNYVTYPASNICLQFKFVFSSSYFIIIWLFFSPPFRLWCVYGTILCIRNHRRMQRYGYKDCISFPSFFSSEYHL